MSLNELVFNLLAILVHFINSEKLHDFSHTTSMTYISHYSNYANTRVRKECYFLSV